MVYSAWNIVCSWGSFQNARCTFERDYHKPQNKNHKDIGERMQLETAEKKGPKYNLFKDLNSRMKHTCLLIPCQKLQHVHAANSFSMISEVDGTGTQGPVQGFIYVNHQTWGLCHLLWNHCNCKNFLLDLIEELRKRRKWGFACFAHVCRPIFASSLHPSSVLSPSGTHESPKNKGNR